MQINTLQLKNKKKKRKTIGRGGKTGTYSGKGMKGQKARSGAHVDPTFEGGRSTLIDHMKKKKGFKSLEKKNSTIALEKIEKLFKDGDVVNKESLIKAKLVDRKGAKNGIKVLGSQEITKKLTIAKGIKISTASKKAIEKAGGSVESEK
jgi:large subunit ribosomal protein L15